jgi:hypothetical protein
MIDWYYWFSGIVTGLWLAMFLRDFGVWLRKRNERNR